MNWNWLVSISFQREAVSKKTLFGSVQSTIFFNRFYGFPTLWETRSGPKKFSIVFWKTLFLPKLFPLWDRTRLSPWFANQISERSHASCSLICKTAFDKEVGFIFFLQKVLFEPLDVQQKLIGILRYFEGLYNWYYKSIELLFFILLKWYVCSEINCGFLMNGSKPNFINSNCSVQIDSEWSGRWSFCHTKTISNK